MKSEDVLNGAISDFKKYAGKIDYIAAKPDDKMLTVDPGCIDDYINAENLSLLVAWMGHFSAKIHQWSYVTDRIERLYKSRRNQRFAQPMPGTKKYQLEAAVERELQPFAEALEISRSHLSAAKTNYYFAENQRDLISRAMTFQTSALKTLGREL